MTTAATLSSVSRRAKAEALAYLEAKARSRFPSGMTNKRQPQVLRLRRSLNANGSAQDDKQEREGRVASRVNACPSDPRPSRRFTAAGCRFRVGIWGLRGG